MKQASLRATILALAVVLASASAFAKTTLQAVRGSGEFQSYETAIAVTSQEPLTMQWTTDQPGAVTGTWRVINTSAGNSVAASGDTPAPAAGHFLRFTIPANAFLQAAAPAAPVKYNITIVPLNAAKQQLGTASAPVVVSQVPKGAPQPPVNFGSAAVYPSAEIVSYDEKIGIVPQTQLHFAGADVTLRVTNKGKGKTDPIWIGVEDSNVLLRQSSPNASVASLAPGASQTVTVHLNAILPPPKSQLPQQQQYSEWQQKYNARCGNDLRGVMTWRGPQGQAPMNDRNEVLLAPAGWEDYAKMPVNAAICDSAQCIKPCQMAANIHKELDGHVVGYAFFAGQYPNFGSYGKARTSADGTERAFTPSTKVTVASVSKIVTAIAAVAILDKKGVSIDAAIGPYLPADWSPSTYIKNLKFSQLLSHTSGIKDYGNVNQNYATLKSYFTQPVSNSASLACQPSSVVNPPNSINPNNMGGCYSNYNFAIFRVLLPKVAGFAEDSNQATRPKTLADQYVKLVQQYVFDPVGRTGVDCKPPTQGPAASNYAFAYNYPGSQKGQDWGDVSLQCGAAGWYLSAEDIAKVFMSLNAKDGKIFAETPAKPLFDIMRTKKLGWDKDVPTELEKNGGWGAGAGVVSTSVAIFGPVTGPRVIGVLFINSNISGGPSAGGGAQGVLEKAYNSALFPK